MPPVTTRIFPGEENPLGFVLELSAPRNHARSRPQTGFGRYTPSPQPIKKRKICSLIEFKRDSAWSLRLLPHRPS